MFENPAPVGGGIPEEQAEADQDCGAKFAPAQSGMERPERLGT
jgi:hypothetical protein